MRKRIVSHYQYPIRYRDVGLALAPGENLVEAALWEAAKRGSSRLRAHIAIGRVEDRGWFVDSFLASLRDSATDCPDPDVLNQDEVARVIKRVRSAPLLQALAERATRGGTKAALRAAVEKRRG